MLHHRTEDPSIRAIHIANREAEEVYRLAYDASGGSFMNAHKKSDEIWKKIYEDALKEFSLG